MTLADYLWMLRRSWWLIALATIVCAGAALVFSLVQTPSYEATASLTIRDPGQDITLLGGLGGGVTGRTPIQIASEHVPEVTRTAVLRAVRDDLGLKLSLDQVHSLVSVEVDPNSFAVNIKADSSNAGEAAGIANAFARADARLSTASARRTYAATAKRLQERLDFNPNSNIGAQAIYLSRLSNLQSLSLAAQPVVVSAVAQVPSKPTSPKPVRNTVAAAIIGLLLGIGLSFGRSMLDRRLRDPADAQQIFDYPVVGRYQPTALGHTGSANDLENNHPGPLNPRDAESFVMLRENVRYLALDKEMKTIAVTSAVPEEGKSTVAACLAMASAAAGTRTLLVECDVRKRVLAGRFGIAEAPGLSDFLVGRNKPREILQQVLVRNGESTNGPEPPKLFCITAGSSPPRPDILFSSERYATFIRQISQVYDQVIIDCPPLLPVADTLEIVPHVDCILMCVRMGKPTRDQAGAAREALERLPERPVGLVLTGFDERDGYYRSYYNYYQRSGAEDKPGVGEPQGATTVGPAKTAQ